MSDLYYIQNNRSGGDNMVFWRVDGHGYTTDLDDAWKVTKEKADSICRDRPEQDIPQLVSAADAVARRHVSADALRSAMGATHL